MFNFALSLYTYVYIRKYTAANPKAHLSRRDIKGQIPNPLKKELEDEEEEGYKPITKQRLTWLTRCWLISMMGNICYPSYLNVLTDAGFVWTEEQLPSTALKPFLLVAVNLSRWSGAVIRPACTLPSTRHRSRSVPIDCLAPSTPVKHLSQHTEEARALWGSWLFDVIGSKSVRLIGYIYVYVSRLYHHVPLDAGVKGRVSLLLTGLLLQRL